MFFLTYISSAVTPLGKTELRELVATSSSLNEQRGVTGLLLYKDGYFMQFIEGERPVIERLFAAICEDTRHHSVQILQQGEQDVRQFPDWWMVGFNLHDEHVGYLPGYSEYSVFPLTHEMFQTAHSRQRLFQSFKR